jgi:hypothetical protein
MSESSEHPKRYENVERIIKNEGNGLSTSQRNNLARIIGRHLTQQAVEANHLGHISEVEHLEEYISSKPLSGKFKRRNIEDYIARRKEDISINNDMSISEIDGFVDIETAKEASIDARYDELKMFADVLSEVVNNIDESAEAYYVPLIEYLCNYVSSRGRQIRAIYERDSNE